MNLHLIDWSIVGALLVFLIGLAFYTNRYLKSVADFLVANRTAGRYLLAVSTGAISMGTIGAVAAFEMYYKAGLTPLWWGMMMTPVAIILAMTGWGVYRYRQTRAMTIQQFLEMRYGRRFRIFCGLLCYLSGITNMGIFPAVSANFFIYFCGFPPTFEVLGFHISTFVFLMFVLLIFSFFFALVGGQITIMVVDFAQGLLCFIVAVVLMLFLMIKFDWSHMSTALSMTAENASLLNPFKTGEIQDFNIWFFLIGVYGAFWNILSWQGNMGFGGAAKTPHEGKMAGVVGSWRVMVLNMFVFMLPIFAYTFMHHPDYAIQAQTVTAKLDTIKDPVIQFQMIVPLVLTRILPIGLMGLLCAVMLMALIACHNSYIHSWGSILIQDFVIPIRNKPFTPKQHIWLLRCSILGVGVFIFFFSLFFQQTEHIMLYTAVTGAIFVGGAGTVIIGGLYWKRGSTPAAWVALIVGSVTAVGGMVIQQLAKQKLIPSFPINGQWMFFLSMLAAQFVYIIISLLGNTRYNMDKLLHRGQYAVQSDVAVGDKAPARGWQGLLTMGKEFTRRDRILYIATFSWGVFWSIVFVIGTVYNLLYDVKQESWFEYWRIYILINLAICFIVTIWVGIGGMRDLKDLFHRLATVKRDHSDDGRVKCEQFAKEN